MDDTLITTALISPKESNDRCCRSDLEVQLKKREGTLACLATANPQATTISRFFPKPKQTPSTQASSSATAISILCEGVNAQKLAKEVRDASQGRASLHLCILIHPIARRCHRNLMPIREDGGSCRAIEQFVL
jgi:hypothetical protein